MSKKDRVLAKRVLVVGLISGVIANILEFFVLYYEFGTAMSLAVVGVVAFMAGMWGIKPLDTKRP